MPPIGAVSLVFSLVLSTVLWIYLLRICFADSTLLGIVALLAPPLALLALLPRWEHYKELFLLAIAALGCISIAVLAGP